MLIPAISVKQPWADRLGTPAQSVETRIWRTAYRGPLAICAAALPKGCGVTSRAVCIRFLRHCRDMSVEDERDAGCPVYEKAVAWRFDSRIIRLRETAVVRGRLGIWCLDLPEYEFLSPDDLVLARRWLEWSKENGFLEKIR